MTAVLTGLDMMLSALPSALRVGRVGLVTNAAAVTLDLCDCAVALHRAGVSIAAIFAPEHGLMAAVPAGEMVPHGVEPRLGTPVYSLYGDRFTPPPDVLASLTHLVVDLPDVGARFYTYVSTLIHVLHTAAGVDIPVIVLDRPNPIGGRHVEGPLLDPAYASFVGMAPVPVRHGMTVGELALLANDVLSIHASLTIIPLSGWRRVLWFDDTGRTWVPPSPNMARPQTAMVYPGTCLVEGTNLSEGRGTPYPFEVVGAPWLDGYALAERLNALELPGVHFRPTSFTPCAGKHTGDVCQGVHVHVVDREGFQPVRTGIHILAAARVQAPARFAFLPPTTGAEHPHFDLLMGNGNVRPALEQGVPAVEIAAAWMSEEEYFRQQRAAYLLYD